MNETKCDPGCIHSPQWSNDATLPFLQKTLITVFMKPILLLLIMLGTSALQAADQYLKVTSVTGTIKQQVVIGATTGKILTTPVNAKYFYDQLGGSKTDYILVLDVTSLKILLLPRSSSAALSAKEAFTLSSGTSALIATATKSVILVNTLSSAATGNVFEKIAGSATTTGHYSGTLGTNKFKDLTLRIAAAGTDTSSTSFPVILKLTIQCQGDFTQAP